LGGRFKPLVFCDTKIDGYDEIAFALSDSIFSTLLAVLIAWWMQHPPHAMSQELSPNKLSFELSTSTVTDISDEVSTLAWATCEAQTVIETISENIINENVK